MPLVYGDQLRGAFDAIVESATSAPIYLFVAADADAICAARIFAVRCTWEAFEVAVVKAAMGSARRANVTMFHILAFGGTAPRNAEAARHSQCAVQHRSCRRLYGRWS